MKLFLIQLILILMFILMLTYGALSIFFYFDDEITAKCRENGCGLVLNGAWGIASPYEPENYWGDFCNAFPSRCK